MVVVAIEGLQTVVVGDDEDDDEQNDDSKEDEDLPREMRMRLFEELLKMHLDIAYDTFSCCIHKF